ncbi:hypothetical protein [Streptomyces fradiae]|uniref:hypothetical protein n=1 Tax=Streptomyces fradiae TaxID=1906 RepID=UPI0029425124|nr:hypothetical protein [Streptomyces fradiae]WOI61134.1 hypothetical protein RYQ63_15215 [Streptomyces fradiae]
MEAPSTRYGVLVLRVWLEDGGTDGVRARIVRSVDGERMPPAAASGTDAVLSAVRGWLGEVLERKP